MTLFTDTLKSHDKIEKTINRYGYAPEHNFWWYQCQNDKDSKTVFMESHGGTGLLTIEDIKKKKCSVFSSPLAPHKLRTEIIIEYLNYALFERKFEKVVFELEYSLYKELTNSMPNKMKEKHLNYTLTWPIYNLAEFDQTLTGNKWKTLRKQNNKFYKNHNVSVVDAKDYKNKNELIAIIEDWRKNRKGKDRANLSHYKNFIINNFNGSDEARVFIVDDKACGINAGWKIPNINRYYGALGIHNYSLDGLGDALYLEDLIYLKQKGYKEADMGGGESALTNFKNKFRPKSFYKTYIFSVVKT